MDNNGLLWTFLIIIGAVAVYTALILVMIRRFFWPDYIEFAEKLVRESEAIVTTPDHVKPRLPETEPDSDETIDPNKSYLRN